MLLNIFNIALLGAVLVSTTSAKSSKVFSKCYTSRASTSTSSVPTFTSSTLITIPLFRKTTSTPSTTLTPPAVTSTETDTSLSTITTTASQITDTFTSTSTETTTTTIIEPPSTDTVTSTTTTTTTSFSGTTTLATPSGFLPALDTIPGAAEKKKKKRDAAPLLARHAPAQPLRDQILGSPARSSYPATVSCYVKTEYYSTEYKKTVTAKTTDTFTASTPTSTATTTTTEYTTSTVLPTDASSTSTAYTTITNTAYSTPSTTTTTTTTSTVTDVEPAATDYSSTCQSDNIVGTINGVGIKTDSHYGPTVFTDDTTPADCCASCFLNPECETYAFNYGFSAGQQCLVHAIASCTYFGQYQGVAYYSSNYGPDGGYFLGNGICGEFNAAMQG